MFANNGGSFSRVSIGVNFNRGFGGAFGDVNQDGFLDLLISHEQGTNTLLLFNLCPNGGAQLTAGVLTSCYDCPNYMRRGVANAICSECDPDFITGGLPAAARCNFACPDGTQRGLGEDTCGTCAAGHLWNETIDRISDIAAPRCVAYASGDQKQQHESDANVPCSRRRSSSCGPGTYADGRVPALGECFSCRAGQFAVGMQHSACDAYALGSRSHDHG
jgi:hypothetical protein